MPPGFFKALQGRELRRKTEPSGLREAQTKARVCQHWGAFGEAYPRSQAGRAWALTFLTGGRRRGQVGEGQPLQLPSRPATTPRPRPNKGQRRPLKQLSRRDAGVQTAQHGGLAAKVRPESQAQEPGKHQGYGTGPLPASVSLVRGGGTGHLQLSCRNRTRDPLCGAPPSVSSPREGCPELQGLGDPPPGGAAFALCSHLLTWARLDTRSASLPERLRGMVRGLGPGSRQPPSASSCSFPDPGVTRPLSAPALGRTRGELPSWEHTPGTRGIVRRGRPGPPALLSSLQVS